MVAKKHPGFDKVSAKIARKEGVSQKAADAILAASSRAAGKKAKKKNPKLKAVIVLNLVKKGTSLTSEVIRELAKHDVPILKTQISDRVNFTRSIGLKSGIYGIRDHKAEKEIDNLSKEIVLLLHV